MKEEIEELIFHMADLEEEIAKAKHPSPMRKALLGHKEHLKKLFDIQELLLETNLEAAANKSTSQHSLPRIFEQPNQAPILDLELVPE